MSASEIPLNTKTNEDLPEHRVAMVVFTTVRAVDARDASHIVERALKQHIKSTAELLEGTYTISLRDSSTAGGPWCVPVRIMEVHELGMACGDGYLHVSPTPKAYRDYS